MTDPYIVKEEKPKSGKKKLALIIGGSVLAGGALIGGAAFAIQQLNESEHVGVDADQGTEFGNFGEQEGDDHDDDGFGAEQESDEGEHGGGERQHGEDS